MSAQIILRPHDPAWIAAYRIVEERIRNALGNEAVLVEHVGSTAVPGIEAKPILDIVLVVHDSSDERSYAARLVEAGFVFQLREPQWHEHRLFKRVDPPANLHVFSTGCPEIERMLRFRDLLQRDADARAAYEAKKRDLALKEWDQVQDYADAKSEIIEVLLTRWEATAT